MIEFRHRNTILDQTVLHLVIETALPQDTRGLGTET